MDLEVNVAVRGPCWAEVAFVWYHFIRSVARFVKMASDKAFGGGMLLFGAVVFVYYTLWALLLPFFDESSPIHAWFLSKEWAARIPAFILVVGISTIGLFLGARIVASHRSTKAIQ